MGVGARIRALRKEKGLTQKQLGERCGMADSAIRFYESDRGNPTHKTIERIANALDVHVFDLVGIGPKLDKIQIKYDRIEPISGNLEDLTPKKIAEMEKVLSSGPREIYNSISDKQKAEFWRIIAQGDGMPDIDSPHARTNAALNQMTEEGREKVADYAEDILPRYRRKEALPEVSPSTDTTPPTDAPETPPEGE